MIGSIPALACNLCRLAGRLIGHVNRLPVDINVMLLNVLNNSVRVAAGSQKMPK